VGERAAEAAAPERDVLLATKLHMPGPRPDLVPRPRLARRLDEGLACGLVLVCAPAEYGKTALLAEWARRERPPGPCRARGHRAQQRAAAGGDRRRRVRQRVSAAASTRGRVPGG
jgi:LuxR family maltose regulon positive regulatory protein